MPDRSVVFPQGVQGFDGPARQIITESRSARQRNLRAVRHLVGTDSQAGSSIRPQAPRQASTSTPPSPAARRGGPDWLLARSGARSCRSWSRRRPPTASCIQAVRRRTVPRRWSQELHGASGTGPYRRSLIRLRVSVPSLSRFPRLRCRAERSSLPLISVSRGPWRCARFSGWLNSRRLAVAQPASSVGARGYPSPALPPGGTLTRRRRE